MRGEPDDSELEELLRQVAARADPVPDWLRQGALSSFAWRTVDADLAELVFDSLVDQDEDALVRGPGQRRMLSFESASLSIDLEVAATGSARTLMGQLLPPRRAELELRQGGEVARLEADELGRFSGGLLRSGPFSLRCAVDTDAGRRHVVTDWISALSRRPRSPRADPGGCQDATGQVLSTKTTLVAGSYR